MLWVALLVAAITLWLLYRKRSFSYLKNLGIPGPEPNIFFGNLLEIYQKDPIHCFSEWLQKYGKVVGYYNGTKATVIVSDMEMLKKIQVSDFHKFINRPDMFRGPDNKKIKRVEGFSQQLVQLRDKRWKEIRSIITPGFTTSKMKQMTPIMNAAVDSFLNKIEEKSREGESFDIYPLFQNLTMDVIGKAAFGIQTDIQEDPSHPLIRSARFIFSQNSRTWVTLLAVSFRQFQRMWRYLSRLLMIFRYDGEDPFAELIKSVKSVIEARRKHKTNRRPDLLQSMIDAEVDVSSITSEDLTATDENLASEQNSEKKLSGKLFRKMTDDDILDNSVLFFLAGYETTSTALAFTTHLLVHHEDVQEKITKEVQDLVEKEGELNYYSISKLQYLDQVLHESLRIYPPIFLFVNRECGEDVDLGTVKLKKGLSIQVPVYNLQRDPNLWEDPDQFRPERFAPENKGDFNPLAFQAFGAGPRNCVGMRFAFLEAKLALAKLLLKYRLKPCPATDKEPITLKISSVTLNPAKGVHLRAVPL